MSGWLQRGGWRESTDFGSRDRAGAGGRCRGPGGGVREGGRPPPRRVALNGEAPLGERAVEGRGDDDGTAGVDPGAETARARGRGPDGRVATARPDPLTREFVAPGSPRIAPGTDRRRPVGSMVVGVHDGMDDQDRGSVRAAAKRGDPPGRGHLVGCRVAANRRRHEMWPAPCGTGQRFRRDGAMGYSTATSGIDGASPGRMRPSNVREDGETSGARTAPRPWLSPYPVATHSPDRALSYSLPTTWASTCDISSWGLNSTILIASSTVTV